MADAEEPIDPNEPKGTSKSPFSGCLLVSVAGLMMLFLVGWALWTLRYQEGEIAKFTEEEAAPVALVVAEEDTAEELDTRLKNFAAAVKSDALAELSLSAADLNLAIAQYEPLEALRETFSVREISNGQLTVDISYQLGKSPFSGRTNFLNGVVTGVPELVPGEVILRIKQIDVPEGEVPQDFLNHMEVHRIMEVYKEHSEIGPVMAKLTSLKVENGVITVLSDPKSTPPTDVPEDLNPSINRFITGIGVIATLFLALVATLLLLARRKNRLKTEE